MDNQYRIIPIPPVEPITVRKAKVHYNAYPPLQQNEDQPMDRCRVCRRIPGSNLKGFWLVQAGFTIDTNFTVEVHHRKLIFTAQD